MTNGNFSNGGVDTFKENKQYIGVRLQQGVPLLDRDWNEAEDIRRYYERHLRRSYIGNGAPGATAFQIAAAPPGADNDFVISPGRIMVDGYDLCNGSALLYSQQAGNPKLPVSAVADTFQVYVVPVITRMTSADDPDLANSQDIHLETCVRDHLTWTVGAVRLPEQAPPGSAMLALIRRPAGATHIDASMIEDARGPLLNLRAVAADQMLLRARVAALETSVANLQTGIETLRHQVAQLLWNVRISATNPFYL